MRKLGYVRIAFAVLGIATFAESQIDRAQAQSYTARSVVAECQKCLDEDVEQNRKLGKHATAIALATALGCLITGPGAAVCFAAVDVAVLGQMMVDISDGSGPECKAHYKACTEMWAALEKKEYTNCELPDPGTKLVKTLNDMQEWVWNYTWAFMQCAPRRYSHNVPCVRKFALPHLEQGVLRHGAKAII